MNSIVIDIGNSNIVIGIYKNNILKKKLRLYSEKSGTTEYYKKQLGYLIEVNELKADNIQKAVIASVVPELTDILCECINETFNCNTKIITNKTEMEIKFPVEDPSYIGIDLTVNAFAAISKYKTNCIVCDLGTATTIQLIGSDGYFYGYAIAPGLKTSSEGMFSKASQLNTLDIEYQEEVLGTDTRSAILAGVVKGHAFMVREFIHQIKEKYSFLENFKTIATGGLANILEKDLEEIDVIDENLTLDGLNLLCQRN